MSRFVLDTDTLTLFERLHPAVVRNVILHLTDHIAVTSITVEEQLGGWFAQLRSARTPQQIESAHARMAATLQTLGAGTCCRSPRRPCCGSRTCSGSG